MDSSNTSNNFTIETSSGAPDGLGELLKDWTIPSNEALVSPLVVRVTDFLVDQGLVAKNERNRVGLCVVEALRNAVLHGNKENFKKRVNIRIYLQELQWAIEVEDQGEGFDVTKVPSPLDEDALWGESGRGLSLINMNMDDTKLYRDGRTIVFTRYL
jgi:serine/threonine-protein kinase RsbW